MTKGRTLRRLGLAFAALIVVGGCNRQPEAPAEPPPPPEPDVAPATAEQVTSLSEMAVEYEQLEQQQAQTNKKMGDLIARYQSRGGSLPPGFGAELNDEQRALLAERIKTERAGLRTLLQDLIERDKEIQQLKTRLDQLAAQLPSSVIAKDGDRHDRISMNFLIKQGVSATKAYEIVSQVNLQDALVPGFRVWNYYQKGQFGTWVTRGRANVTPQEHQKRLTEMLEQERDQALKQLVALQGERDELRAAAVQKDEQLQRTEEELKAMAEVAEKERAEVMRRETEANTIHFVMGSKKTLVDRKIIERNMRRFSPEATTMTAQNLADSSEIPIDAASLGLKRIRKVTLLPEIFRPGVDYAVTTGGPSATLRITVPDKFRQNRFVIVVE